MIDQIRRKLLEYKAVKDVRRHRIVLDAADLYLKTYGYNDKSEEEFNLGIDIFNELVTLSYIGSLREFEHNYELQKEILIKKIKVFKSCIPESHARLRGLTELLVGMKENSLG